MASVSSIPVAKQDERRKSCDTVCSSNSSCFLKKRKPVHPLACPVRTPATRSGGNIGQRIHSAKVLKLRQLQNQLSDANFHLAELTRENKALRTLQQRQEKALAKYEGENADVPKILLAHEEEVRVLNERIKSQKKAMKELNEQLKQREEELLSVKDQLKHLMGLSKDKSLGEREKLKEEVEYLREQLEKSRNEVNVLNRKLILESKSYKYKLNTEIGRHKHTQRELRQALLELERLGEASDNDAKGKSKPLNRKRVSLRLPDRQVVSMVSLHHKEAAPESENSNGSNSSTDLTRTTTTVMKPPMDNVLARLSNQKEFDQLASSIEKLNINKKSVHTISSRPTSAQKLDNLDSILQSAIKKTSERKESTETEVLMGKYCSKVVSSVRTSNETILKQQENLDLAKQETECIMEKVQDADKLQRRLKRDAHDMLTQPTLDAEKEVELVSEILREELMFQTRVNKSEDSAKRKVGAEDKRKLLEALKAIDNGENVDISVSETASRKASLMKELFGD